LKLLALEEMLVARQAENVVLQSSDRDLAEALGHLCDGLGAAFEWRATPKSSTPASVRGVYDALPFWLQGLLSFRHLARRWKFTSLRPVGWTSGPNALFFCSYLFNLDAAPAVQGKFHSHQWEGLPASLHDHGFTTNWLHQFLPDGGRTVAESLDLLRAFNKDGDRQGRHAVLETFLSISTMAAIVRDWLRHIALGWRLRHIADAFTPKESNAWLWPLLREDWRISMSGTAAVTNCTCRVLLDAAVEDLPYQSRGFVLFEGQGWETALAHAWRKRGHGEIIGVPHSSMPFWYLSIYDDPRCYQPQGPAADSKPLPDRWAVNGKRAWNELADAGMPETRMAPVEALRFQHLAKLGARPDAAGRQSAPRLLLLGDFTRGQTLKMIRCLASALTMTAQRVEIAIKRHPVCPVEPADAGSMPCEFIEQPIGDVLHRFDIAFASNTTSASLDALLTGVPVIVFLDDACFNQSPLRGAPHVRFVSRPRELADAIDALTSDRVDAAVDDFFWTDDALPKWSALVAGSSAVNG
jgi:surface carbohydrate biosynthesis protein (TIGR04326 family)